MNRPAFEAPTPEAMNGLLPAFEFDALLTVTSSGAIYLAVQRSLDRKVAIKVLSAEISSHPEFRASFESTARAMAKLNHPNLIGIYDSGIADGMLYFVMEFVPGKSLEHSARNQRVELSQTLQIVNGICAGLAHAHRHGIVHGRLDPSNILLNQKAEPVLGNFGFVRRDETPEDSDSASFIAPEVREHRARIDPPADVYSVGAILYRLLTGVPHAADARPPSEVVNCPKTIDKIWGKATDPDPSRRYADIPAMVEDLGKAAKPGSPALRRAAAVVPATPGAAAAAPANGESPPKPPPTHSVGLNWKLLRNLVIIAGLLFAIKLAWDLHERKSVEVARQNREAAEQAAAEKERLVQEARERAAAAAADRNRGSLPPDRPDITPPKPREETAGESLERLRESLAAGKRAEMPRGSVRRGDSHYFLVTEDVEPDLSWIEAAWFAERHGAHLAIPNQSADLTWLVTELAAGNPIWIGGGRSGTNEWTLADGTPWKPTREPTGLGLYLGADKHGLLRAAGPSVRLPFILQWRSDGSNPARLEAVLASTKRSLSTDKHVYPPGTRAFGERRFMAVARDLTWRQAHDLAQSAGGNLAVPSEASEASNLDSLIADATPGLRFWLGGLFRNNEWKWVTGEEWKFAKWSDDARPDLRGGAVFLSPKSGWQAADADETLSGFIIEWSPDAAGAAPADLSENGSTDSDSGGGGELATLSNRARDLIIAADRKRSEQLAANARRFSWDLDIYLRGVAQSTQAAITPQIQRLKATVTDDRVPSSVPRETGISLTEQMAKVAAYASSNQDRIDAEFAAEAGRIHAAFVSRVNDALGTAEKAGQPGIATSLKEALTASQPLDRWVATFGVTLKPANPTVTILQRDDRDGRERQGERRDERRDERVDDFLRQLNPNRRN